MRSLKESILKSNNASVISILKDIASKPSTEEGVSKLNKLWEYFKLNLSGFKWRRTSIKTYVYGGRSNSNEESILWMSSNIYASDILVAKKAQKIGFSRELSSAYCDALIKKLNLEKVIDNDSYYYLNFK